jgi:hypothetical protein
MGPFLDLALPVSMVEDVAASVPPWVPAVQRYETDPELQVVVLGLRQEVAQQQEVAVAQQQEVVLARVFVVQVQGLVVSALRP